MAVPAGLLPRPGRAAQARENAFQIRPECLHSLRFRARPEQLLLEVEIKRQRAGQMIRECARIGGGEILHRARERQNLPVQFYGASSFRFRRCPGLIGDEQNLGAQKGALLIEFEYFKTPTPLGNEIETTIGIFLRDADDLGGASDLGYVLLDGANNPEQRLVCQTLSDHLLVSRFENVQRQGSAGKQHDLEREQGEEWHSVSGSGSMQNGPGYPIVRHGR
jgi:hypothetical protein